MAEAWKTIKFFIPTAWMGKTRTKIMKGLTGFSGKPPAEPSLESRTSASKSVYPSPTFASPTFAYISMWLHFARKKNKRHRCHRNVSGILSPGR